MEGLAFQDVVAVRLVSRNSRNKRDIERALGRKTPDAGDVLRAQRRLFDDERGRFPTADEGQVAARIGNAELLQGVDRGRNQLRRVARGQLQPESGGE